MQTHYTYPHKFRLESGAFLNSLRIAYTITGNPQANETIWVCHALTGNADVTQWWAGIFGENKLFDPDRYRIICANVIGSCYGSSGPADFSDPLQFPTLTIRDMVSAHELLRRHLQIVEIDILIGASLGGQQALEWALEAPKAIKKLILIASNAAHSPFARGFNEAQRLALASDSSFGKIGGGRKGLKAARAIAMLSYRSYDDFEIKRADTDARIADFKAASYLRYQGDKFVDRFDPYAYFTLTKAMDSHDVSRGRGTLEMALQSVKAQTLVIGVSSDLLFPLTEQHFLAAHIPHAEFGCIESVYGHDAFLIEFDRLSALITEFLFNGFKKYKPTTFKHKNRCQLN